MNVVEQLEQQVFLLDDQIDKLEDKRKALLTAIGILAGADSGQEARDYASIRSTPVAVVEEEPRQAPPPDVSPRRQRVEIDTRPLCPACGGHLEPGQRTLGNGKVVNLLMCTDSGCNHEQF